MTDTLPNVLRYPTNIEHLATDTLVPYARNSRTHSPEQVAQIAASIREYGFTNPVLIDANNTLIAGHGRIMAAQHLGLPTVPAIRLAHLTDAQRRAYVIADAATWPLWACGCWPTPWPPSRATATSTAPRKTRPWPPGSPPSTARRPTAPTCS